VGGRFSPHERGEGGGNRGCGSVTSHVWRGNPMGRGPCPGPRPAINWVIARKKTAASNANIRGKICRARHEDFDHEPRLLCRRIENEGRKAHRRGECCPAGQMKAVRASDTASWPSAEGRKREKCPVTAFRTPAPGSAESCEDMKDGPACRRSIR